MNSLFCVELLGVAQKDLKGLWKNRDEIVQTLLQLERVPDKGHFLTQDLQGIRSLEFSIKGSGQYRAAYIMIEEDRTCTVLAIGPRENFYSLVKGRLKLIKDLLGKSRAEQQKKSEPKRKRTDNPSGEG